MTKYSIKFNKESVEYMNSFSEKLHDFLMENLDRWPPRDPDDEDILRDILGEDNDRYDEFDVFIHVKVVKHEVCFACPSFLLEEFMNNHMPHLYMKRSPLYWFNKIAFLFYKDKNDRSVRYNMFLKSN